MAYKTPGVYVEEISKFPPSVVPVETAIPAFIGYTDKALDKDGKSLGFIPTRIGSLLEYEALFGGDFDPDSYTVTLDTANDNAVVSVTPNPRRYYLYACLRHFYANGGGACYVVSVGSYSDTPAYGNTTGPAGLAGGLSRLERFDEPTLILFPDGVSLAVADLGNLQAAALGQCEKLQDRFVIMDLRQGDLATSQDTDPVAAFRDAVGTNSLKYGAAYYPWLRSIHKPQVSFRGLKLVDTQASPIPQVALDGLVGSSNPAAPELNVLVAKVREADSHVMAVVNAVNATVGNNPPTGGVTITGTARQGGTLTASATLVDNDGLGEISYHWNAGATAAAAIPIVGATGKSYTPMAADVGKVVTVTASYTDSAGYLESVTSLPTAAVVGVPNQAPTGTVTITGTAQQGETLTASNDLADADGLGAIAYQWNAGATAAAATPIAGATGGSYRLTDGEAGKVVTVTASYTDGAGYLESVTSLPTAAVAAAAVANQASTGTVTITGTAQRGETLTASNDLADADGLGAIAYQWNAGATAAAATPIAGATGDTYRLTAADVGKIITVTANYIDGQGYRASRTSAPTEQVSDRANTPPTGRVRINGTALQGQTLVVSNDLADADGLGDISYQWNAGATPIAGATGGTYTLTAAEVGKVVTVTARYTDGLGYAESVTSFPTMAVAVAPANSNPLGRRDFADLKKRFESLLGDLRQASAADTPTRLRQLLLLPRAVTMALQKLKAATGLPPEVAQALDSLSQDAALAGAYDVNPELAQQGAIVRLISLEKNLHVVAVAGDASAEYWPLEGTTWIRGARDRALGNIAASQDILNAPGDSVHTVALKAANAVKAPFEKLAAAILSVFSAAEFLAGQAEKRLFDKHPVFGSIAEEVKRTMSLLPPSGAVAGVYAAVDRTRGVWKAPANVSLADVVGPAVRINDAGQADLNVTPSGKSINAIRAFAGKGTLVWGARTLAGNDNEWRYVPVRRFFNMAEESIKKATEPFVFEPNDANTWVRVRAMIDNFLTVQWRQGALAGAVAGDAFYVKVGLGETMSALDILEGRMIVEIGMAVVRPAEFIILRFSHKMQSS